MSIFIQEVLGLLNRNQKKVTLDKAKDGVNIPRSSTRANEPVQSAAFKSGYRTNKK